MKGSDPSGADASSTGSADNVVPHATARNRSLLQRLAAPMALAPGDLLRERLYRRLWLSILISSFASQITMLAIPLTAAVLLHATPTQMGLLTAVEIAPFVMFSLPSGVWLDRVRKLPVYVGGELAMANTWACAGRWLPAAWVRWQSRWPDGS